MSVTPLDPATEQLVSLAQASNLHEMQRLQRAILAKEQGLPPEEFSRPWPGSNTVINYHLQGAAPQAPAPQQPAPVQPAAPVTPVAQPVPQPVATVQPVQPPPQPTTPAPAPVQLYNVIRKVRNPDGTLGAEVSRLSNLTLAQALAAQAANP
jgi:hypothetical protein